MEFGASLEGLAWIREVEENRSKNRPQPFVLPDSLRSIKADMSPKAFERVID